METDRLFSMSSGTHQQVGQSQYKLMAEYRSKSSVRTTGSSVQKMIPNLSALCRIPLDLELQLPGRLQSLRGPAHGAAGLEEHRSMARRGR